MSTRMIPTLFIFVLSAAASCWGQESRGSITGTVQVTAAAPLLDTTTASGGRVLQFNLRDL